MNQLVIKQEDIYKVDDNEYFKFTYLCYVQRDVYVELSKNNKYILEMIAQICNLNYKGLGKKQLVELIENSGCLVLGD